jgi:hypothetical protein
MFNKLDVHRILRRAAEMEGAEDTALLTVEELRSIAGEAGFGAHSVDRAIAEARKAGSVPIHRNPVQRSGVVITHLSTIRTIPIEISSEQLMTAVRLFQPYREGPAQVNLGEHEMTWRDRTGLRFTVTTGGGVTQIRVFVSKIMVRRGRWMGWVNAAADTLESLVSLVASGDEPGVGASRTELSRARIPPT